MSSIESDLGRIDNIRDPPGQRSLYIPPGEPNRETYRLATFYQYPRDSPIDPLEFAACGFYYTGYQDRVKCFSCGQTTDNWTAGDDITLSTWHQNTCRLMNGTDNTNVPIGGSLLQGTGQQAFQRPAFQYASTNPVQNLSRTSESTNSVTNISTSQPTATNCFQCSTRRNENASTRPSSHQITHPVRSPHNQMLFDLFPCHHPVNPHMRTFIDNSSIWPAHRIRATPQQIVDAGMYYLGEWDRVKCWYCNGGLQNWERDNNPWKEHAKWFPLCEYGLQQKGLDYVHKIVARFPGLRRPNLSNPTNGPAAQMVASVARTNSSNHQRQTQIVSSPAIVDPQTELRRINEQVEEEIATSQIIADAKLMGFEKSAIRAALKRQYIQRNTFFKTWPELERAVLEMHTLDLQEEKEKLRESLMCAKCRQRKASVLLLPCGHRKYCTICAMRIERCVVCKEFIGERIPWSYNAAPAPSPV